MEHEVIHLRGESVFDRLQRSGPLPWAQSARIGVAVAEVLETAHRRGQVHGCVRPQHILLGGDDRAVLAGFAELPDPARRAERRMPYRSCCTPHPRCSTATHHGPAPTSTP
jgi:hypothetical protein